MNEELREFSRSRVLIDLTLHECSLIQSILDAAGKQGVAVDDEAGFGIPFLTSTLATIFDMKVKISLANRDKRECTSRDVSMN